MTSHGTDDKVASFVPLGAQSHKIVGRIGKMPDRARVLSLGAQPLGEAAEGDCGVSPSVRAAGAGHSDARPPAADNLLVAHTISCPVALGDILVGDAL